MGKIGKLLIGIFGLGVIVVVGLTVFVKFYLTDERVRGFVVPQAESTLGRKVAIGSINVGLFSGISLGNFSVKDQDGTSDFLSAERFVIAYDLLPLLHKNVVVSEIKLVQPRIVIKRDKNGQFNFQTLKVLTEKKGKKEEAAVPAESVVLPVALTVDTIKIVQAGLAVRDETGQLPDLDVIADVEVAVKLGSSLDSLAYDGRLDMTVDAKYGDISPTLQLNATFDSSSVNYTGKARVAEERLSFTGTVRNYLKSPQVVLSIVSEQLNLEYLAALGASLPQLKAKEQGNKAKPKAKAAQKVAIAESLPPGLTVDGSVAVTHTTYKKLAIKDFILKFGLKDGILTVDELTAKTAGGTVDSSVKVDLNKPDLAYDGEIKTKALNVTDVGNGLGQAFATMVSGTLEASLDFAGSGMDVDSIKKALTAKAEYSLLNGQFSNTGLTDSIASLLKVQELKTITFSDMSGALELLQGGKVQVDTGISGGNVLASTKGTFDLDGNLDLPVKVTLPKTLLEKIDRRGSLGQYLADDDGSLSLVLDVAGTYLKPQVSIEQSSVKKQVKKAVVNTVIKEIEKSLSKDTDTAGESQLSPKVEDQVKGLLKGLFGQ